jgi:hypothetical protein
MNEITIIMKEKVREKTKNEKEIQIEYCMNILLVQTTMRCSLSDISDVSQSLKLLSQENTSPTNNN